jgi:hypothetical protein
LEERSVQWDSDEVYMWVEWVDKNYLPGTEIVFDAMSFIEDEEIGEKRRYCGDLHYLSRRFVLHDKGKFSLGHFQKMGMMWVMEDGSNFPELPFLMTSNAKLKHICYGNLDLEMSDKAKWGFGSETGDFLVVSDRCLAIINNDDVLTIDVFSESEIDMSQLTKERFVFAGMDVEIGTIKSISPI